jgi:hypothetical protein
MFPLPFQDSFGYNPWADEVKMGERLGVCLERLPSLLQAQFSSRAVNRYSPMVLQYHVRRLTKMVENIKKSCGSKGEVLELELRDYGGNSITTGSCGRSREVLELQFTDSGGDEIDVEDPDL